MISRLLLHFKKIRYFKNGKTYLKDGVYYLDGQSFYQLNSNRKDIKPWNKVKIQKKNKLYSTEYSSGIYVVGQYKAKFLFKDYIVFFVYSRKRFCETMEKYNSYVSFITYDVASYSFDVSKKMIATTMINGERHNDDSHFNAFINKICEQYLPSKIYQKKDINNFKNIPFFIQHGDCKNSNIIWQGNKPILIDLEAIDSYPIFYDLFYYIFITKKENTTEVLDDIRTSIINVLYKIKSNCDFDPLDYYLSCYFAFLCNYISKKCSSFVAKFYLGWINYITRSDYPLLNKEINKAKKLVRKIR